MLPRPLRLAALALLPWLLPLRSGATPLPEALALLEAAPTAEQLRPPTPNFFGDLVVDAIGEQRGPDALMALTKLVGRHFSTPEQQKELRAPTGPALAVLEPVVNATLFLQRHQKAVAQKANLRPEVLRWLLRDPQRLQLVATTFSHDDDVAAAYRIVEQLHDLDPQGRDTYFNLILAMAVVWDQPATPLHRFYEADPAEPDLANRYTNLRDLYARNKAKLSYKKLTAAALVLVVDTPVPVSELEWAQKKCRWSAGRWSDAYTAITYDAARGNSAQCLPWADGSYTLEAIQEKGGIGLDQAYFATLTARANGIPAILSARSGAVRLTHGWFSYLRGENKWDLDFGRYQFDTYASGQTVSPQTRKPLSNLELPSFYNRVFDNPATAAAVTWCELAAMLQAAGNNAAALALAEQASKAAPTLPAAWNTRQAILAKGTDKEPLLAFLRQKQEIFKGASDILFDSAKEELALLRSLKREPEAKLAGEKLYKQLEKANRGDLCVQLGIQEANELNTQNQPEAARLRLEKLLDFCKNDVQLALPLVSNYLELTNNSNQQKQALRYLESYIPDLQKQNARLKNSIASQAEIFDLLLAACANAGDEAKSQKYTKKSLKK